MSKANEDNTSIALLSLIIGFLLIFFGLFGGNVFGFGLGLFFVFFVSPILYLVIKGRNEHRRIETLERQSDKITIEALKKKTEEQDERIKILEQKQDEA